MLFLDFYFSFLLFFLFSVASFSLKCTHFLYQFNPVQRARTPHSSITGSHRDTQPHTLTQKLNFVSDKQDFGPWEETGSPGGDPHGACRDNIHTEMLQFEPETFLLRGNRLSTAPLCCTILDQGQTNKEIFKPILMLAEILSILQIFRS